MPDTLEVQWTFDPPDFFEETAELRSGACTFTIAEGLVTGRGPLRTTDLAQACNELHQRLETLFLGAQLVDHRMYQLNEPFRVERVTPGGARHLVVIPATGNLSFTSHSADSLVADAAGNVVESTRRDRLKRRVTLSMGAAEFIDEPVANSVIRSYSAAVNDPRNELVHLYEIRDALSKEFGGERAAQAALGIGAQRWRDLGRLACHEPLVQGRHRGQHPGMLRSATPEELSLARGIAQELVERYLDHRRGRGSGSC